MLMQLGGNQLSEKEFVCAREGCEEVTERTTHNQKYCTPFCRKTATNANIMRLYHKNAAIKRGANRTCNQCGITKLSRYNLTDDCGSCETKMRETSTTDVASMLSSVSWL